MANIQTTILFGILKGVWYISDYIGTDLQAVPSIYIIKFRIVQEFKNEENYSC